MDQILNTLQAMDGRLDRLFEFVKLNTSARKVETVTGFVIGKRKDGQPCLWVYGPEQLQFKLCSLWKEQIPDAPFYELVVSASEDQDKAWPTAQAPTRCEAVDMGYFVPVECDAVFITDGTMTESGRLVYRFDHWFDPETEEEVRMSQPRPQIDYTAVRQRATASESDASFVSAAFPLYSNTIESEARLKSGVSYIRGENPNDYRAMLVALDLFCDMMASGHAGKVAGAAGQSVYVATLNTLLDIDASDAAPKQSALLEATEPVSYGG